MSELLYGYHKIDPTTWAYLSSLLMVGLYFKFSRFWSVRNLDLVLLIMLAPGLLLVHRGQELRKATPLVREGRKGLPDGVAPDAHGNLFASGPGGVLVLSPEGRHLGTIDTRNAASNCAFGDDGATLYITAHMHLARIRTRTRGAGF